MNEREPAHLAIGKQAEDAALAHLQSQGLHLIERNYRCRAGEIDLVMRDGPRLVFVEVRYRADLRFGGALESVDWRKRAKLIATASLYLAARRIDRPSRFDVVAVSPDGGKLAVQWIQDAFQA
ncbi:MAG: YraN family protein [Methylococcaceae bacterium]|nr:YraN family protein [Methylococcaceae bacterium]